LGSNCFIHPNDQCNGMTIGKCSQLTTGEDLPSFSPFFL
jgi:hypothetical protein